MIEIEGKWICAGCKEGFIQSIKEGVSLADLTVARQKKRLVMGKNATLPDRCVKCNAPADGGRLPRRLYWHPGLVYLLLLVNILIYALVAIISRKRANIEVGLCARHRSKRRTAIWVSWGLFVASVGLFIALPVAGYPEFIGVGVLAVIFTVFYAHFTTRVVGASRIDKEYAWLAGVCREYLDELPEWVKP